MLELALADTLGFAINRTDIDRPPPSRTAELLAILSKRLAPASLVFLMGEDALRHFPSWHDLSTIGRLAGGGPPTRAARTLAPHRRAVRDREFVRVDALPNVAPAAQP